jgi:hypothetical protein
MKCKQRLVQAAILSAAVSLGAESLFAQTAPGGGLSGPANPSQPVPNAQQPGPTFPQPGLTVPQEGQRSTPTQPTPGLPQSKPLPGQPTPGSPQTEPIPGQTAPLPGQPGTIPERFEQPGATNRVAPPATSTENPAPKTGARLEGERRSVTPPPPQGTTPLPGETGGVPGPGTSIPGSGTSTR